MSRKTFLTIVSVIATSIGLFSLFAPSILLGSVKMAEPSAAADVQARTVGILLVAIGLLDFLARKDPDSPSMKAILTANLVLQIGIAPIDPLAYATGAYKTFGSFLPNSILHLVLASGFAYFLVEMNRRARA